MKMCDYFCALKDFIALTNLLKKFDNNTSKEKGELAL